MSDLPSSELTYGVTVAEFWLGLRGAGLVLSPLDREQVAEWERRGLPVGVVCRGLRRAFEEQVAGLPNARPPRSLRACRGGVEAEWSAFRSGRVGDAPPPPSEATAAAARLAAARALLAAGVPPLASLPPDATLALERAAPSLEDVERRLAAVDAVLLRAWLASLPRAARAALGRRLALRAGPRPPAVRRAAHRAALLAHLEDAAREAGLLRLRGSV